MASDLRRLCIDRGIQDATFVAHSLGAGAAMLLCLLGDLNVDGINLCPQNLDYQCTPMISKNIFVQQNPQTYIFLRILHAKVHFPAVSPFVAPD